MIHLRRLARLSLGTLVVPATAGPIVQASVAHATDDSSSVDGVSPESVDVGTLQSCTAQFGLTKGNSHLVSFDVQGSLASSAVIGDDLAPVYEYDNGGTPGHCLMERAWDNSSAVWDTSSATNLLDVSVDPASRQCFLLPCDSQFIAFVGLVPDAARTHYLVPKEAPVPNVVAGAPRIILVPVSSGITEADLTYDGSIPSVTYYLDDMAQAGTLMLRHGREMFRAKLATIDSSVLTAFDAMIPADMEFASSGDCPGMPEWFDGGSLTDLAEGIIRTMAHSYAIDYLLDSDNFGDPFFTDSNSLCAYTIIGLAVNGYIDDMTDRAIIEVTAGALPETGFGSSELAAASVAALLAGATLLIARRRLTV